MCQRMEICSRQVQKSDYYFFGKEYYAREEEAEIGKEKDLKVAASTEVLLDKESPSIDEDLLLESGM